MSCVAFQHTYVEKFNACTFNKFYSAKFQTEYLLQLWQSATRFFDQNVLQK